MPRITTQTVDAVIPSTGMVASAAHLSRSKNKARRSGTTRQWQERAWHYYDTTGELRYAATWFGNALSRATLRPARRNAKGEIEYINSGPAHLAAMELMGGAEQQSSMLKAMGLHYFIAGEWFIVGREIDREDVFEVAGVEELKQTTDGAWILDYGDGEQIELTDEDVTLRVWNPHPRKRNLAESPVMSILSTLAEIDLLTRHIAAQVRSRLAGAGLLILPNEVTFTTPQGTAATPDEFLAALSGTMEEAISEPGSPAAMVPIMLKVPGEWIDKIRHMTFWSDLDQQAVAQRDAAIRRLALGLDLPPEVLLGTADVNHWGSWQIEESTIKSHIEPALEVIAASTTIYLREALDDDNVFMVFDTSELRLRPNRSKEAMELWDRGELNGEALRRETGFDSGDIPDDKERVSWLLRKVASGSASPEQVQAALKALGVVLEIEPGVEQGPTREARPDPSLQDHPTNDVPDPDEQAASLDRARLMATCEALTMRAMERVGNRLKNSTQSRPQGVESHDLYQFVRPRTQNYDALLEGSWTTLPHLMSGLPFEVHTIEAALDNYMKGLIATQEPHDRERMMRFIDAALKPGSGERAAS